MINPDAIIKTNRRSISITISKAGEVIVHAPKRLPIEKIMSFVIDKESWILKKQKEIKSTLINNNDLLNYKAFNFCGKKYLPCEVHGIKKIELSSTNLLVPENLEKKELLLKIEKWYIKMAKLILGERLEYFANLMQLDYNTLSISNSKNRWGSCDINGNIKLNYRVIMLPHKLIDYIIIHELAHLIEMNHSKKFYNIIECIMPDYSTYRKQLKDYFFLLQLFKG